MTSLRWLKLNRTGLCYLPEELAALQKLVSPLFWNVMRLPCPTGAVGSHGSLFCASLVAQQRRLQSLIIVLSYNVVEVGCRSCQEWGWGGLALGFTLFP